MVRDCTRCLQQCKDVMNSLMCLKSRKSTPTTDTINTQFYFTVDKFLNHLKLWSNIRESFILHLYKTKNTFKCIVYPAVSGRIFYYIPCSFSTIKANVLMICVYKAAMSSEYLFVHS